MKNSINIACVAQREIERDRHLLSEIASENLLDMFYRMECSVANAHIDEHKPNEWNYIPYSHLAFYDKMKKFLRGKNSFDMNYLELGCGLGTKLYIAKQWLNIGGVTGIEIHPAYAEIARQLVGDSTAKVLCMDVREFDDYANFDIIYSYSPLKIGAQQELIENVKKAMKSGATLFEAIFSTGEIRQWRKP